MRFCFYSLFVCLLACGDDDRAPTDGGLDSGFDAGSSVDAGDLDASEVDAGDLIDASLDAEAERDAGSDAGTPTDAGTDAGADAGTDAGSDAGTDAGMTRTSVLPSFCPSGTTAAGFYRGTLAGNTNDVSSACGLTAPGRDGSLRVAVPAGATLRVVYTHAQDGVVYLLDRCPVLDSCLGGRDATSSGAETLEWTNTSGATNEVFVYLDSFELGGAQTFELDLFIE